MKWTAPKGTRDILPPESELWREIITRAEELFCRYGYEEIILPVMESTELFVKGIGAGSDIVQKEMFTFQDKGGRSLTLRPEGTAGVARAFIEHNLAEKGLPLKLYYKGPMFRHERPQAGRYRQFHQLGVELIGSPHPLADAEVILLCARFFQMLGLSDIELVINSVGDERCRPRFVEVLMAFLGERRERLCVDCQRRLQTNPLRVFDCKVTECKKILAGAPRILDHLCGPCRDHLRKLEGYLTEVKVPYRLDPSMVRGLDYYTRTVFEFQQEEGGSQNALAAGGRYDHLIETYGGKPTPSTGFSIGVERVASHLSRDSSSQSRVMVYLVAVGEAPRRHAFVLMEEMRSRGVGADMDFMERSMKAQMKMADRAGSRKALIIGEEELQKGYYTLRDMEKSTQLRVDKSELWKYLEMG